MASLRALRPVCMAERGSSSDRKPRVKPSGQGWARAKEFAAHVNELRRANGGTLSEQDSAELDRMLDELDLDPPFDVRAWNFFVDDCPELPRSEPDCRH